MSSDLRGNYNVSYGISVFQTRGKGLNRWGCRRSGHQKRLEQTEAQGGKPRCMAEGHWPVSYFIISLYPLPWFRSDEVPWFPIGWGGRRRPQPESVLPLENFRHGASWQHMRRFFSKSAKSIFFSKSAKWTIVNLNENWSWTKRRCEEITNRNNSRNRG